MKLHLSSALAMGAIVLGVAGCGGNTGVAPTQNGSSTLPATQAQHVAPLINVRSFPVGMVGHAIQSFAKLTQPIDWSQPDRKKHHHHKTPHVYFSNLGGNAVEEFKQKGANQTPSLSITSGINFPAGLTFDSKGNLYVVNEGANNVTEYPHGKGTPGTVFTKDLSTATDVVVGEDGTIYIANFNGLANGWVTVYPQGNISNDYKITDFGGGAPLSVALDKSNNLYVMYDLNGAGSSAVNEYAPGATTGTNLNLSFQFGAGIQVDKNGNIAVVQQVEPSEILVFAPGQTTASQTITLPNSGQPFAISINAPENTLFAGDSSFNLAQSLAWPSGNFNYTIGSGFQNPSGVAVSPDEF